MISDIDTDAGAVDKAVMDALMYGTGIVKFSYVGGKMVCDHVAVAEYDDLAIGLKWLASQVKETPQ